MTTQTAPTRKEKGDSTQGDHRVAARSESIRFHGPLALDREDSSPTAAIE